MRDSKRACECGSKLEMERQTRTGWMRHRHWTMRRERGESGRHSWQSACHTVLRTWGQPPADTWKARNAEMSVTQCEGGQGFLKFGGHPQTPKSVSSGPGGDPISKPKAERNEKDNADFCHTPQTQTSTHTCTMHMKTPMHTKKNKTHLKNCQ